MDTTVIKKESKNKIRVDFERAPLRVRLKEKYLNTFFLKRIIFMIFKIVLLVGISFIILYPYITKIFNSFMSPSDFKDVTVVLLSKNPTLDQYKAIITENNYFGSLLNSLIISSTVAIIQTIICALVGYGLAKFKFKGNNLVFILVILTMMVPQRTLQFSMQMYFSNFDTSNILGMFLKAIGVIKQGFRNSYVPIYILSVTALGFKNGLFIFMLRQFFKGVPDELEESAYVDGSNTFRTFFSIIIPLAVPMLVTIFIFSFAWEWTDNFYSSIFFTPQYTSDTSTMKLLSHIVYKIPDSLQGFTKNNEMYQYAILGTSSILVIMPLIIAYLFIQNKIVQGIERSGIIG